MKRYLGVLLGGLILAALVFAGACADDNGDGNGDGNGGTETPAPGAADGEEEDLFAVEAAETLSLDLHDIAYEPTELEIPAGEVVEITLTNSGQTAHDFTIEDIDAHHMAQHMGETPEGHEEHGEAAMHYALEPGDQMTVRLQVHEPGEYEFYCTVAGHREAGMHGTLTVQ